MFFGSVTRLYTIYVDQGDPVHIRDDVVYVRRTPLHLREDDSVAVRVMVWL